MNIRPDIRGDWDGFDVLVVSPTPTHPQDHGNRKRVFEICNELKNQGANIHFVHYASELDWRAARPAGAERDMIAAWASYQLVAPTRPLHETARGADHTIDEWADPALSGYVRWICSTRKFDAVIVNYTWLSFCFDSVPDGTFKILDTNDIFSDRRAMLEGNGIAPEFFHTTACEEAKALARADLVWAIKPSEQAHFERLGAEGCICVLHAEPERSWWTSPPSADGWLRVGVIGARNNVNRRNLEMFLDAALPIFERYVAPVKIIIAGGCSQDFESRVHRNIEVMGRIADVAQFYSGVDAVAAPMQFSTGLKIKVSEALASGAPVIAHVHAMEGYPTELPTHKLPCFEEMAAEIVKLAFDPSGLKALAAASHVACRKIQQDVQMALAESRRRILRSPMRKVLVAAPLRALDRCSLLFDHLCGALDYLATGANAVLYITGAHTKADLNGLSSTRATLRVLIEPALGRELGEDLPEGWTPCELKSALETRQIEHAYFLCDPPELSTVGSKLLRRAYVRHDAVALSGGDPLNLIEALRPVAEVAVVSAATRKLGNLLGRPSVTDICQAPCLRSGQFHSFSRRHTEGALTAHLLILGTKGSAAVSALATLAKRVATDVIVIDPDEARQRGQFTQSVNHNALAGLDVLAARLIVDLTDGDELAAAIVEGALRHGIPVVTPALGAVGVTLRNAGSYHRPATIGRLLDVVARGLGDKQFRSDLLSDATVNISTLTGNDAGWLWLRQDLQKPRRESRQSAAEALFA